MTGIKRNPSAVLTCVTVLLVATLLTVPGCQKAPDSGPGKAQPPSPTAPPAVEPLGSCKATRIGTPYPASPESNWSGAGLMVVKTDETTEQETCGYVTLEVEPPASPGYQPLTGGCARSIAWGPNGCVAFVAARDEEFTPETVYLRYFGVTGNPFKTIDLLPGDLARHGVSKTKVVHGWLDDRTLAYEEHMGTGVQKLGLVDTSTYAPIECPELLAFSFHWQPGGSLLLGDMNGPAGFWIWDRASGKYVLESSRSLSDGIQRFQAWGPAAKTAGSVFFSASAEEELDRNVDLHSDLYEYDLKTRSCTKIANDAGPAEQAGGVLAYVKLSSPLTLVVKDLARGTVLWEQDLGALAPPDSIKRFKPVMCDGYVLYRTSKGEWWLSPTLAKQPVLLAGASRGPEATAPPSASLSPDGAFAAIFTEGKVTIFRNPFKKQTP